MKTINLNLGSISSKMGDFDLEKAVCNHGVFMMPPNTWIPSSKTLRRPLRLSNSKNSVFVSINQPSSFILTIQIHSSSSFSSKDQQAIVDQVVRMLRITEKDENDLRKFQMLHPRAKEMGFGRLFRSPTLFEDAVKSILLCNTSWRRTLAMARELCDLQAGKSEENSTIKKRKRKANNNCKYLGARRRQIREEFEGGNFPNATELSRMSIELLRKHFIGYRAVYIIQFAKLVDNGRIDLQIFEKKSLISSPNTFPKIKGFGPFATANIFMCLGFYHQLPIDTETIRHLKQVHGREFCSKKTVGEDVKEIYDKYAPFQCLAYWFELVEYYESKFGKLSELCSNDYHKISGSNVNL